MVKNFFIFSHGLQKKESTYKNTEITKQKNTVKNNKIEKNARLINRFIVIEVFII